MQFGTDVLTVPLSGGAVAFVDAADWPLVAGYTWAAVKAPSNHTPYATRHNGTTTIFMHRVILGLPPGREPQCDHRDLDSLNNRRSNLRIATPQQNRANCAKHAPASSRYKGVGWHKDSGRWQAGIKVNGRRRHLGHFDTEEAAARAYDEAARILFGPFARCNYDYQPRTVQAVLFA